ncbi:rhomboid family intramembrane serine protease [Amycolatopsis cihanbeyliensis]|uniref:Membrane associated rhomboid family serine protease n=1 Tax=Amycolatopsis cihanbeyliensis TaxID=1128664 RepID=A0A542DLD7_AMYCI|nr:rhomboid family intramembrane serine protease [Amycolatopsis cihanbeyliensis]TQJ03897.1 membrane associated rhomboid family serine protease [Amycolatopsis cihanbeyliensis]
MNQPPYPPQHQQQSLPGCWWHPDRQTGLRCTRCERPACPDCLREASVGYQCIDCVHTGQQQQRAQRSAYRRAGFGARTIAGARPSSRAVVVPVLIALNVLVYLVTAVQAADPMGNHRSMLHQDGVLWPLAMIGESQWWRLVTSGFLHYGLIHLAINMIALWILGRDLELLLGKLRFTALYLVSLLGGSVAVFLFDDLNKATAGASGAIYGLLGAMLVAVIRLRINPTTVLAVLALNIIITFQIPGISLFGHLGGLVVGILAMIAMVYSPERDRTRWQVGTLAVLTVAMIGLVVFRDAQLADASCQIVGSQYVCYSGAVQPA